MNTLENIVKASNIYLNNTKTSYVRDFINDIDWDSRLIGIKGPKGVGKSTLLLQYIKLHLKKNDDRPLYVSMDNFSIRGLSIIEIAEWHMINGGTHLFIDEIHKYPDWHIEIKNIADMMPDLKVVFTGSSFLQIHSNIADLSRRVIFYNMPGLSLREYIKFETGKEFDTIELKDLLKNHVTIAQDINNEIKIMPLYSAYLKHGYYPFYLEGIKSYNLRIDQVINNILEVDLPYVHNESMQNIFKLKKLLSIIASSVPFTPNISKLSGAMELHRNKVTEFIYYLYEAKIINILTNEGKGYSSLTKPEKVYLNNTNLQYTLSEENAEIGTIRECFFLNQMEYKHHITYPKKGGDFLVDDKYIFEVGGRGKNFTQIANQKNSYLVIDEWMTGVPNKIPLWMFGFLY
jgi:uncharacterized protein